MDLKVNGRTHRIDVPADTPLLWVVREELGLTGSKFGCGRGICGACTMHLNGTPTRTCILPVAAAEGQNITTIEGLSSSPDLTEVQKQWIAENVPQCGYCQSGQIMQAVGWLDGQSSVTEDELVDAMAANLCRCGSYIQLRTAIVKAARTMGKLREASSSK